MAEPGTASHVDKWIGWASVAIVLVAASWRGLAPIAGFDVWWHLALGRHVLESGSIPATDPFSYTFAGEPWPYKDWGAAVLLQSIMGLGGPAALVVAKWLVCLTMIVVLDRCLHLRGVEATVRAPVLALIVAAIEFRLNDRPQIISYLMAALVVWLLQRHRLGRGRLIWVVPVALLAANLHRGALALVAIVGAYVALDLFERGKQRRFDGVSAPVAALVGVALACLATPSGLAIITSSVDMVGGDTFTADIPEWSALTPALVWKATPITYVLAALAVIPIVRPADRWDRVSAVVALALAALGLRFLPYLALIAAPAIGVSLVSTAKELRPAVLRFAALGTAAIAFMFAMTRPVPGPTLGIQERRYPDRGIAFVRQHGIEGPMLNEFAHGGYLIYHLAEHPVYIDGRNDIIYTPAFRDNYVRVLHDADVFLAETDGRAIQWLFLDNRPEDRARVHIDRNPDWALVHVSRHALIYVRRSGPNGRLAETLAYAHIAPHDLEGTLARAFAGDGRARVEPVLSEAQRLIGEDPSNDIAHVFLAKAYGMLGAGYEDELEREYEILRGLGRSL